MTVDQAGEEIKKIKNTFKNLQSFFKNLPVKFPYLSFHMQSRQTTKSDSILYILRIHHLTAEHTSHIDLHFGMWPNSVTKLKCKKKKRKKKHYRGAIYSTSICHTASITATPANAFIILVLNKMQKDGDTVRLFLVISGGWGGGAYFS